MTRAKTKHDSSFARSYPLISEGMAKIFIEVYEGSKIVRAGEVRVVSHAGRILAEVHQEKKQG